MKVFFILKGFTLPILRNPTHSSVLFSTIHLMLLMLASYLRWCSTRQRLFEIKISLMNTIRHTHNAT